MLEDGFHVEVASQVPRGTDTDMVGNKHAKWPLARADAETVDVVRLASEQTIANHYLTLSDSIMVQLPCSDFSKHN